MRRCVDAGLRLALPGAAGQLLHSWDSRANQQQIEHDSLLRPVTVREHAAGQLPKVVERFTYGDCGDEVAAHNQCGRLIRHDDPAGTLRLSEYSLFDTCLVEARQFLSGLEAPDWPPDISLRDDLLEDGKGFITAQTFTATNEMQTQIDAMGNLRIFDYTVAGELKETRLQLAGSDELPRLLVGSIHYNALGQIESETAGNRVVNKAFYGADDGRLIQLLAGIPGSAPLQNLNYCYDPVGNIVSLEDKSQSVRYFNNQRIDPINCYRYDSLYQLVEASGREVITPGYGLALPALKRMPLDSNQLRNYTQSFLYDAAGNLLSRHHSGAPTFNMSTSSFNNHSLAQREDGSLPDEEEITNGFDANGNQQELQRGQAMSWDVRNQLSLVTMVKREDGPDDLECHVYDRPGHRLRKVRLTQAGSRILRAEVRYLPGLEIHRDAVTGEERQVISVEAGRSRVWVLHWETKPPDGISNDQVRFSLSDHLGSCTLELDEKAGLLSQEGYYPFGGTAWWVGRSTLEAKYKTIRYSGKERDASGLYYYGYRYYAPWLCRWMSPDPAGTLYGQNLYRMVENRPTTLVDMYGLEPVPPSSAYQSFWQEGLRARLDSLGDSSQAAQRFIKDRFKAHELEPNSHEVSSTYFHQVGGHSYESWFVNEFHEDIWIFKQNYKTNPPRRDISGSGEPDRFHASDVARYQYELVASQRSFFGKLPSVIKRENVMSYIALANTVSTGNDGKDLMNVFFTKTPNGKSTMRIMEDFDLEPVSVERIKGPEGRIDFLIRVQPKTIKLSARQANEVDSETSVQNSHEPPENSRYFEADILKGSIRRGSIDMERVERRGSYRRF